MRIMGEAYLNLKRKLEELGYNNLLPLDAVPLVECIVADLLQTTRSLQHYMDLSKEALVQRDSLMLEAEPYKCDNAKLIQENNRIHRENMRLKEENIKLTKDFRRKIKSISEELTKKDSTITKLQHDLRDFSLRGLCADTCSSRNKSKRKESDVCPPRTCLCSTMDKKTSTSEIDELNSKMKVLEDLNNEYRDEITLLKAQVEHRDDEIIRLNMLLEGGRPLAAISKDCCNSSSETKLQSLLKEIHDLESANRALKKEMESCLEKQHEAMLRALTLADKNKVLQEEIKKVDSLALRVEEDCNKRLSSMMNEVNFLQTRIESLTMRNLELEQKQNSNQVSAQDSYASKLQGSVNVLRKDNYNLQREIKELMELNKAFQDKILLLSNTTRISDINAETEVAKDKKCPTKEELQTLLEHERKKYESHIKEIQDKMSETFNKFNKLMQKCKEESPKYSPLPNSTFIRDIQGKLCESEQKILMLKKENEELKDKLSYSKEGTKQNYKDIISQLNIENSELSKENIELSQQLTHYKNLNTAKSMSRGDYTKREVDRLKDTIADLTREIQMLKKDKNEYNTRYKETMEIADKLKRDIVQKQKEIEQLEEENCSYKMTNRKGKASGEYLREECNFLKEQLKKIQSDVVKEKTLASQIKNIQLETERSSNEIQNELLSTQRQLSLSKDTIETLEKKCRELQSELNTLRNDKSNLISNFKTVDQDRDKLVIELDNKTEIISMLEQKVKSQNYEINKLENEIAELRRKINTSKITEHQIVDNEAQIIFLNTEIQRLNQELDNARMENKHLQNNIADLNANLKLAKIEYDKSRKEVDGLKQQLQHYVVEVRRIEEMLSQKEAERSDMLEQFASLSVEANILENTNHSLESESASKSQQLMTYVSKIENLEATLIEKETIIESQASRIAALTCKITSLENEIKLVTEEKIILEQNAAYLKQMCNNLQTEHSETIKSVGNVDSELQLYENRIRTLSDVKSTLKRENDEMRENYMTTERLLSEARKEIVELKLALQDATSETKSLHDRLTRRETELHESTLTREEYDLPIMLEEIHEVSHEEDEDSSRYRSIHKRLSKYTNSSTL